TALLKTTLDITAPGGKPLLAEPHPGEGTTLAGILPPGVLEKAEEKRFLDCENKLLKGFAADQSPEVISQIITDSGWKKTNVVSRKAGEKRLLAESLLDSWLSTRHKGSYGAEMAALMGKEEWEETALRLKAILAGRTVHWDTALLIISASA
ncbi:MAG: hypothetical protein DRP60_17020, partial [Spirochaetes bacterium]